MAQIVWNLRDFEVQADSTPIVHESISFDHVGEIYAKGGTNNVEQGGTDGLRRLRIPSPIKGKYLTKKRAAPMPQAELFALNNLEIANTTGNLVHSLGEIKFCFGRGSLVKLLEITDNEISSHYKKDIRLRLTKRIHSDNVYYIVEDTEQWTVSPEYGHSVADLVTQVNEGYEEWYHYVYHVVKLEAHDVAPPLSFLLRNEVDAVDRSQENLHVEIKSHNYHHPPDMMHYAYCVLTGQTAGLYIVARRPLGISSNVETARMLDRNDLKSGGRVERYLRSLSVVKKLLSEVYTSMLHYSASEAYLEHKVPQLYESAQITLKIK